MVIPNIIAFTISGITDIIAISDISTSTIRRSKKCKKCTQKKTTKKLKKKPQKIEDKCTPKIFIIKHRKKFKKTAPKKIQKNAKTHRNCKNHTKNAKSDTSGITYILPGFSPYWLSLITSFHHIGDNRYYRDILELVPTYYRDILESVPTLTLVQLPPPTSCDS